MTRAERRHDTERIKAKVVRQAAHMRLTQLDPRGTPSPAWIGKAATTHWTCTCVQCKGTRKHRKPAFERTHPTKAYL